MSNAQAGADPRNERLVSLQWLRAIAAAMVVVHHALFNTNTAQGLGWDAERSLFGFANWTFGIHIFFVVSGFIMITSTHDFGEPGASLRFLSRRLVRIVPLYWIITTLGLVTVLIAPSQLPIAHDRITYVLGSYLFFPVPREIGDLRPLVGQGWTLNYEMYFYVVFAIGLFLPRMRAVAWMSLMFAMLCFEGRNVTTASPALYTWTDGLVLEFMLGVYVGLAWLEGWRLPLALRALAVAAGFALAAMKFSGPVALVSGVPASLILIGFMLGPQPAITAAGATLALIGDASYSLYLTHTFILRGLSRFWTLVGGEALPAVVYVGVALLVTISGSHLIYRYLERPMTKGLQRRVRVWMTPAESRKVKLAS